MITYAYRLHQSQATACPIPRQHIHMQRIQAEGAMVAITAVCQRRYGQAAMGAYESNVFCFSAHTEPSGYLNFKYRKAGFCLFLKIWLQLGLKDEGLRRHRPILRHPLETADTSASCFKGASHPLIRTVPGFVIVPGNVWRVLPPSSGWRHSFSPACGVIPR